LAFFSAGASVSKKLAPAAARQGAVVIDNSSAFRMDPEVPLVVPEVNAEALRGHSSIISNPNCSTIVVAVALAPLHELAGIKRLVVSTYQAASGVGGKGISALERESRAFLEGAAVEPVVFPFAGAERKFPLAFNLVPHVDVFEELGYTKEEWKLVRETRKIFGDGSLAITVTNVRVPVFRCHAASVNAEVEREVGLEEIRETFSRAEGLELFDEPSRQRYPMPLDVTGRDAVRVGRLRPDNSIEQGWNFWVVGDQIRKGAALNAVQIGESLIEEPRGLKRGTV
jgi:aspartate-semialdehyde dehydrogenase